MSTWVIQLFDAQGYYTSVSGLTVDEVKQVAFARAKRASTIVAMTLPFVGMWRNGMLDVTAPQATREAFRSLERGGG